MKPRQPVAVHDSSGGQHSHVARHAVSPAPQVSGTQLPRMHASHSPHTGMQTFGSHR